MAKTNGAEFKRFYNDEQYWPKGVWHEAEILLVDGRVWHWLGKVADIQDSAQINVLDGVVRELADGTEPSFEGYFQQWQRQQGTLRNPTEERQRTAWKTLFELTEALNASASNDGCDPALTVVSAQDLDNLVQFVTSMTA